MTIVNDDARIVNKLEASLIDKARVLIYDRHMFIVQAMGEIDGERKVLKGLGVFQKIPTFQEVVQHYGNLTFCQLAISPT
jgi:hypothetical protein